MTRTGIYHLRYRAKRWLYSWIMNAKAVQIVAIPLLMFATLGAVMVWNWSRADVAEAGITAAAPLSGVLPAERALVRRLDVAANPLLPPLPPAQFAPPPTAGRLFRLDQASRRNAFRQATERLRGIQPQNITAPIETDADATADFPDDRANAATTPDSNGCPPTALVSNVRGLLTDMVSRDRDPRDGMIHYHLGLLDLCAAASGEASKHFEAALVAFRGAERRTDLDETDQRRLSQYIAATNYGAALARAGWPANRDADMLRPQGMSVDDFNADKACRFADAQADLLRAKAAADVMGAATRGRLETRQTFVNFGVNERGRDLLKFSTADVLSAQAWLLLRAGTGNRCERAEASSLDIDNVRPEITTQIGEALGDDRTLRHPALAANGAVLALIAARPGTPDGGNSPGEPPFAGDPQAVKRLHSNYANAMQSQLPLEPHPAWERVRAVAAIIGADFSNDIAASDQNIQPSALHDKCQLGNIPAFALTRADQGRIDRLLCLRSMRTTMADGDAAGFQAKFTALADPPANLGEGFAAAANAIAAEYKPVLVAAADDHRQRNEPDKARGLEKLLSNSDLFDGSLWAFLRMALGGLWYVWLGLTVLVVGTGGWCVVKGKALRAASAALFVSRHHSQRMSSAGTATQSARPQAA
jgi:hypothetical protein